MSDDKLMFRLTLWERVRLLWLSVLVRVGLRGEGDVVNAIYDLALGRAMRGEVPSGFLNGLMRYYVVNNHDGSVYEFPKGTSLDDVKAFTEKLAESQMGGEMNE